MERNAFEEPEKPTVIQKAREQLKQSGDPGFWDIKNLQELTVIKGL